MATRKILTFTTSEVAPLVTHAKAAEKHRCTCEQLFDPKLHFGGKIKYDSHDWPDSSNIDASRIEPALWLVKDQGAYLMSNGVDADTQNAGQQRPVAYAAACDPTALPFDEWYDNARTIVGGDDCCIALPLHWFEQAMASGVATIRLQVLKRAIKLLA